MGGDDYVIDDNGAWATRSDALIWYRQEVRRLKAALEAERDPVETARNAMRNLTPEQRREIVDEHFILAGVLQPRADSSLKTGTPNET
jgi:hypothetical protein